MKGLLIFLTGVAAGVTAGLLLAPEKGSVNRARLKECLKRRGLLPDCQLDLILEEIKEEMPESPEQETASSKDLE